MAGAYKRKPRKSRIPGKPAPKVVKWTGWYFDENGKKCEFTGTADKATTVQIAQRKENECRMVREGLIDKKEVQQRDAGKRPLSRHLEDYRLDIRAKGATAKHADQIHSVLGRLFDDAGVSTITDMNAERLQAAIARIREKNSTRTANHALNALKSFAKWLDRSNRIIEVPPAIAAMEPYPKEVGLKRIRRALTKDEVVRLLAATEAAPDCIARHESRHGQPTHILTGHDRMMLYRVALGTGFRVNELASLTPLSFRLDGDKPTVRLDAAMAKNGKGVDQPIRKDLAAMLRAYLKDRVPSVPVWTLPLRVAEMLAVDLGYAKIKLETIDGVLDFHALRATYITHLILSGVNVKVVQKLARHGDVNLTLNIYTKVKGDDLRDALEDAA